MEYRGYLAHKNPPPPLHHRRALGIGLLQSPRGGRFRIRKYLLYIIGSQSKPDTPEREREKREFFIDNLLVRIHFLIEIIWWTGLAPWELEFLLPGSLIFTFV